MLNKIKESVYVDVKPGMILVHDSFPEGFYFITDSKQRMWLSFDGMRVNANPFDFDWDGWRIANPKNLFKTP